MMAYEKTLSNYNKLVRYLNDDEIPVLKLGFKHELFIKPKENETFQLWKIFMIKLFAKIF